MMFVVIVVAILAIGLGLGLSGKFLPSIAESGLYLLVENSSGVLIHYVLVFFIFIIGVDLGLMESRIEKIKMSWKSGFLLFLGTVSGSLFSGFMLHYLTDYQLTITLAVCAGMGWYSLTGPFLAKTFGAMAGALGFTSNFIREFLTIILYPRLSDKKTAISIGGATTMDSTLPIITRFSNPETALIAFIHGFFVSLIVPVLLSIISSF